MTKMEATLATTNVDLHDERLTIGALQSMVEAINASYIPMGIEHDRRPP